MYVNVWMNNRIYGIERREIEEEVEAEKTFKFMLFKSSVVMKKRMKRVNSRHQKPTISGRIWTVRTRIVTEVKSRKQVRKLWASTIEIRYKYDANYALICISMFDRSTFRRIYMFGFDAMNLSAKNRHISK